MADKKEPFTIHEVHVEVGRTVNDGDYGSERVTVGLTASVDPASSERVVAALTDLARQYVHRELRRSPVDRVKGIAAHEEIASKRIAPEAKPEQEVVGAPA